MSIKYARNLFLTSASILALSTTLAFAEGQVDDESRPDVEQGTVLNADAALTTGLEAEMLADPATVEAIREWKLADYHGVAIHSEVGDDVGIIEHIAYDAGSLMYLIVSPLGIEDNRDERRVVPISNVTYDADGNAFVLDTATRGSIDTMQPYDDTTMSNYTVFTTDDELGAFDFDLQGSSELNSN